ncbi:hypothetical protein ACFL35_02860 [Candidatus Riflebacteria bacterium]
MELRLISIIIIWTILFSLPVAIQAQDRLNAGILKVLKSFSENQKAALQKEGDRFKKWAELASTKSGLQDKWAFRRNLYLQRLEQKQVRGEAIQKFLNNFLDNVINPVLEAKTEKAALKIALPNIRNFVKGRLTPIYNANFKLMVDTYAQLNAVKKLMRAKNWNEAITDTFDQEKGEFYEFEQPEHNFIELKKYWESIREAYSAVENMEQAEAFSKFEEDYGEQIRNMEMKCTIARAYLTDFQKLIIRYKTAWYALKNYRPILDAFDKTEVLEEALEKAKNILESFANAREILKQGNLSDPNDDLEAKVEALRKGWFGRSRD